jgi:ATP-dependent RNA helicase RhlE
MDQGHAQLGHIEVLVLDEADRMLDMGFIHDVRKIVGRLPAARQTLFFSATMPDEVAGLARNILRDPVRVEVTPVATTAEKIDQSIYFVEKADKRRLLAHLLGDPKLARVLVFTRTKHGADRVVKDLARAGFGAQAIHGNKGQSARERALAHFKDGTTRVLVATDIAARGIDVDDITHVVNFDLPNIPESYVHRIGRTARAGATGVAVSFCDHEEREYLVDIERLIRMHVPRVEEHPYRSPEAPPPPTALSGRRGAPPPPQRPPAPRPPARHGHAHPRPQPPRAPGPAVAASPATPLGGRAKVGRRSFGRRRP